MIEFDRASTWLKKERKKIQTSGRTVATVGELPLTVGQVSDSMTVSTLSIIGGLMPGAWL